MRKLLQLLYTAHLKPDEPVLVLWYPRLVYPIMPPHQAVSSAYLLMARHTPNALVPSPALVHDAVAPVWDNPRMVAEEVLVRFTHGRYLLGALLSMFAGGGAEDFCEAVRSVEERSCIVANEKALYLPTD